MSFRTRNAIVAASLALSVAGIYDVTALGQTGGTAMDTSAIERLTGAKGALDEKEGVFKVSVPRKDLSVVIAGVKMTPPMGLTSWASFKRDGQDDMVMGDLVLVQDQISPVMSAALDNGLEVTALHNHSCTLVASVVSRSWRQQSAGCLRKSSKPVEKLSNPMPKSILRTRRWTRPSSIQPSVLKVNTRMACINSWSGEQLICMISRSGIRWG